MKHHRAALLLVASTALACGGGIDADTTSTAGHGGTGAADVGGAGGGGEDVGGGGAGGAGGSGGTGCASDLSPEPGQVITSNGAVRGQLAGETYVYKGIPFAAPPVGSLRFRPPEPRGCIDGVLEAATFGSWCPQPGNLGDVDGDEDCLTLNVWAPVEPPASPRAVMVWIHGGGNTNGSSARGGDDNPLYDGQPYVEQADVVFVSINFRLGALGFMSHPALTEESPNGSSGNNALLDQIAALEWVRDNIAHFGGDPQRVMVFGQSSGAMDICSLMTSPLAAGLFHRALMSSGACVAQPLATREARGATLASSLGCSSGDIPACLRALPVSDIVAAQPSSAQMVNPLGMGALPWGPTVDGYVLPKHPLQAIADGDHHDVPFVIGSNSNEASLAVEPVVTPNEYEQIVHAHYGQADGDLVLQMYTPQIYGTARRALIALSTDATWTCPVRRAARAAATSQSSAVYRYFFTHGLDGGLPLQALGAVHALDVFFVFQHAEAMSYTLKPAELALSQDMLGYWSRFAITGDPNGAGAVDWPSYAPTSDPYLALDTSIVANDGIRTAQCDLLDSL